MKIEHLIYGTSDAKHIVACEYNRNGSLDIFYERPDGTVERQTKAIPYYLISDTELPGAARLTGDLPLKWLKTVAGRNDKWQLRRAYPQAKFLGVYDDREAAMQIGGFTYFKDMVPGQVSTLAFDIEGMGLTHDADSKVLLISNTFRRGHSVIRKLFVYNEYDSQADLLLAWCQWVREIDPSIIVGHNIFTYDFPYMDFVARRAGIELCLGRDNSALEIEDYESKFRRDGSQYYHYRNVRIYGRNIVDTFFTAIKYDVARRYDSYGLKSIIKQEGLEKPGRQHYDASQIRLDYLVPDKWEKIKAYSVDDADDALALYDLAIPAFFYLARSVPKTFQALMQGASGSQINSILCRSYIQASHSLPLPTEATEFEGAISLGNPGVYENVFKVDVASLYPSIMLEWEISDRAKDPLGHFLQMLSYLTDERLNNKRLAKETGERHYKDLESAQKIIINSVYGLQGAPGISFNMPTCAAKVTRQGREILQTAIELAKSDGMQIVNADTDSISVSKGSMFVSPTLRQAFLRGLNSKFPVRIKWEDDGMYDRVLVLKAKNYVLDQGSKRTIKGSALKATPKEPALRDFIKEIIDALIYRQDNMVPLIYRKYVSEITQLTDISRWSSKKTITENVLNPGRTNEAKVLDAILGTEYAQGDKRHLYFTLDGKLALAEHWNPAQPNHDVDKLLEKLYKTLLIFKTVYDPKNCLNFKLKRNKPVLSKVNQFTNTIAV